MWSSVGVFYTMSNRPKHLRINAYYSNWWKDLYMGLFKYQMDETAAVYMRVLGRLGTSEMDSYHSFLADQSVFLRLMTAATCKKTFTLFVFYSQTDRSNKESFSMDWAQHGTFIT